MKIATTKSSSFVFFGILAIFGYLSCQRNHNVSEKKETDSLPKQEKNTDIDTVKGFFVKYPFTESATYLIGCENTNVGLLKIITQKDIEYKINVRHENIDYGEWEVPIFRDVNDFIPIIKKKLDPILEKALYKSKDENFVIEFEYGTAHVKWSYLYKIDKKHHQIYLSDVIYSEPVENSVADKKKTSLYLCRFPINKTLDNLPYSYLDSLFNHFDKVSKEKQTFTVE